MSGKTYSLEVISGKFKGDKWTDFESLEEAINHLIRDRADKDLIDLVAKGTVLLVMYKDGKRIEVGVL